MTLDRYVRRVDPTGGTFVVRIWLPDRPGALGAVASRIGAVRGDVVAIDVLERGGGRAVDELTVSLEDAELIDLLVAEIGQVDGVDVEDVRAIAATGVDRVVTALRAARFLAEAETRAAVEQLLCEQALVVLGADWVCLLDAGATAQLASAGSDPPPASWLAAFTHGVTSRNALDDVGSTSIDELTFAACRDGSTLVLSRVALPLRAIECAVLDELVAIASARVGELGVATLDRSA